MLLKKQEICADFNMAYEWAKENIGQDEFDDIMADTLEKIIDLQRSAKKNPSLFMTAMMMVEVGPDPDDPEDDEEVNEERNRLIKASVAWFIFIQFDYKWHSLDDLQGKALDRIVDYMKRS